MLRDFKEFDESAYVVLHLVLKISNKRKTKQLRSTPETTHEQPDSSDPEFKEGEL